MAHIAKHLDTGCTEYILLDDRRTIVQPKDRCDMTNVPSDYKKQLEEITRNTDETIYMNKRMIKDTTVGREVSL
ncbi:MAG: hypothetical protein ACREBB_11805 [Nitrosotalea sp.]